MAATLKTAEFIHDGVKTMSFVILSSERGTAAPGRVLTEPRRARLSADGHFGTSR